MCKPYDETYSSACTLGALALPSSIIMPCSLSQQSCAALLQHVRYAWAARLQCWPCMSHMHAGGLPSTQMDSPTPQGSCTARPTQVRVG